MPELPEVETVRRDLRRAVKDKKIERVDVEEKKMVRGSAVKFKRALEGQRVIEFGRRGKLLIAELSFGQYWLTHMKMTGQLIFSDGKSVLAGGHPEPSPERLGINEKGIAPNKHTHIIVYFEGGGVLFFNDIRKFGYMEMADQRRMDEVLTKFGVEPLSKEFTPEVLREALKKRKVALKSVLLEQRKIAGLGNIYVDETCFAAGLRPGRRADRVTLIETKRLYLAIKRILKKAVAERGTTFGTYRDGFGGKGNYVRLLKVYQRGGKVCLRCREGVIVKTRINGRGTAYCPVCQK